MPSPHIQTDYRNWVSPEKHRKYQGEHSRGGGYNMTPRETEILTAMSNGCSYKQIAMSLGISDQTVKNHMSIIRNKFGHHNNVRLCVMFVMGELK